MPTNMPLGPFKPYIKYILQDKDASYDFLDDDDDPTPLYDKINSNAHGTKVSKINQITFYSCNTWKLSQWKKDFHWNQLTLYFGIVINVLRNCLKLE